MDPRIWPVILSGGVGARLWPLSRAESPKQLLPLAGERTLIEDTVLRAGDATRFHPPVVVGGAAHADAIEHQLSRAGTPLAALIVEPAARNTAPAIALAASWAAARDPQALLLVMPSDHVVLNRAAFLRAVDAGAPIARDGWFVTFGIRARAPETGYGYIRLGAPLGGGVMRAERFIEKPSAAVARTYVEDGGYTWNGGIFLMRADRYLSELGLHAPAIADAARQAMAGAGEEGARVLPDPRAFLASPSDSIDYAVMERAAQVAAVPVEMGWSDIGNWDALHAIADTDARGNALRGDVIEVDAHRCLLRSEGPLIAAVGVSDLTVVATTDAILVAARERAQDVKRVVDRLKADNRAEASRHARAQRIDPPPVIEAPPGWAIRLYTPADAAAVLAIFDGNTPDFFAPVERGPFADQLDDDEGPAFVIEGPDGILAYGGYNVGTLYNRCYLNWGMAARAWHGRGLGSALLWTRIAHLLKHASHRRWLAVDTTPPVAAFFQGNGFVRLSDWPAGYASGLDMVELRLDLGGMTADAAQARAEAALAHAAGRGRGVLSYTNRTG